MDITITFPNDATLLIKNNQEVDFETFIYQVLETDEIRVPLAQKIKINPSKIFNHLTKFAGEEITEGELIAVKKQLFSDLKYFSKHTGIIKEINHETGEIIIQIKNNTNKKQKSFFKGLIKDIKDHELILTLPTDTKFIPAKKVSFDFGGKICYLQNIKDNLNESNINNKIIIAEVLAPYVQAKLEALGAKGFTTLKSLPDTTTLPQAQIENIEDFLNILNYNFQYCLVTEKDQKICFYN